jgi:hypothetical protein
MSQRFPIDVPFLPRQGRSEDELRETLESVIRIARESAGPRRGTALEAAGDLLLHLGETDAALLSYTTAMKEHPERFLQTAQKVLALDPSRLNLALRVGEHYLSVPDPRRAAEWLEAVRVAAEAEGKEEAAMAATERLAAAEKLLAEGVGPSEERIRSQLRNLMALTKEGEKLTAPRDEEEE